MPKIQDYKTLTEKVYKTPKSVQQLIPIYRISEDGIFELENKPEGAKVLYDRAYLFEDANFATMDNAEENDFLKQYCAMLNSLNVSFKIIIMNNNRDMAKVREDVFLRCRDNRYKELTDSLNKHIENSLVKGRAGIDQVRLFVISCQREDINQARDYFHSLEGNLALCFNRMQSGLIPLNAEERLRYLYDFYRMGEEENYNFNFKEAVRHGQDWKSYIAPRSVQYLRDEYGKFDSTCVQIDGRYVRALCLPNFPNTIDTSVIRKLMSGPQHVILTIDAAAIPPEVVRKTLDSLYLQNERAIEKQQEERNNARAWSSDITYDRKKEKDELESYMDIANEEDEKMFYVGILAIISSETQKDLENDTVSFCQSAETEGFIFQHARWNQLDCINTALPTGTRYCTDHMRTMFAQPLCALTPFSVHELYHPGGIFYGINQISKNILVGDRKLLSNGNGFVLGVTGYGKSMFVKMEIAQAYLRTKDDIIIIDPQNEYRPITEYFGGQYVEFGSGAGNYINPLDLDTLEFMDKEKFLVDKTQLMCSIFTQIKGEISSQERSIIGRCVKQVYEPILNGRKKKTEAPTLVDFYEMLGEQEEYAARDLKLDLEIFVNGALDMFSKPTNVNTSNRLTVYGIADLGEEQSGIGMLIMLEGIRSRISRNAKKGRATWLYIDEFHNMTHHQYTANYFEKVWKEVRKQGGICTAITQNIADCLALKTIETMLCNSEYITFFNQSEIEMEILRNTLRISDNLLEYVQNTEPGCGLLKFGGKTIIPFDARLPKDSEMYKLTNTNFHELQRMKKKDRKKTDEEMENPSVLVERVIENNPMEKEKIYP